MNISNSTNRTMDSATAESSVCSQPTLHTDAGRVIIIAGSTSDGEHVEALCTALRNLGISPLLRIASAHKTPKRLLELIEAYDREAIPTVYIAVAGRSNALSGFIDAATRYPVIACPPLSGQWGAYDIWSSLRMPSGVAPAVVLEPANAALCAAKMLALHESMGNAGLTAQIVDHQKKAAAQLACDDERILEEQSSKEHSE